MKRASRKTVVRAQHPETLLRLKSAVTVDRSTGYFVLFGSDYLFYSHGYVGKHWGSFKVKSLTVTYHPSCPVTQGGLYCAALADTEDVNKATSFSVLATTPTSVVLKSHEKFQRSWKPREPEEQNFLPFNNGHNYCSLSLTADSCYDSSGKIVPGYVAGVIIVDLEVWVSGMQKLQLHDESPIEGGGFVEVAAPE